MVAPVRSHVAAAGSVQAAAGSGHQQRSGGLGVRPGDAGSGRGADVVVIGVEAVGGEEQYVGSVVFDQHRRLDQRAVVRAAVQDRHGAADRGQAVAAHPLQPDRRVVRPVAVAARATAAERVPVDLVDDPAAAVGIGEPVRIDGAALAGRAHHRPGLRLERPHRAGGHRRADALGVGRHAVRGVVEHEVAVPAVDHIRRPGQPAGCPTPQVRQRIRARPGPAAMDVTGGGELDVLAVSVGRVGIPGAADLQHGRIREVAADHRPGDAGPGRRHEQQGERGREEEGEGRPPDGVPHISTIGRIPGSAQPCQAETDRHRSVRCLSLDSWSDREPNRSGCSWPERPRW